MKFKEILNEQIEKNLAGEMIHELDKMIKKIFPKSGINVRFSTQFLSGIDIGFTYGKNKSEYPNGIIQNDPLFTNIYIGGFDNDGNMKGDNLEIPGIHTIMHLQTHDDDPDLFDYVLFTLRKKGKIKPKKVVAYLKTYFEKMKNGYKKNKHRLEVIK